MKNIDKIQIAEEMMTAAIVEYLEHRRYYAAINLAGVAEELYGKLIRISGGKTMRDELIDSALDTEKEGYLTRKDMKCAASYSKNAIKHMDSRNDRFIKINAESEARYAIAEAMENRDKLNLPPNKFLDQFSENAKNIKQKTTLSYNQ